ncbi:MAG: hypothetical protein H0T43_10760, partial [Solirubrobacterales bacterium]|nr:hypothetical protein [Solirubrobacterales bacterium]
MLRRVARRFLARPLAGLRQEAARFFPATFLGAAADFEAALRSGFLRLGVLQTGRGLALLEAVNRLPSPAGGALAAGAGA